MRQAPSDVLVLSASENPVLAGTCVGKKRVRVRVLGF